MVEVKDIRKELVDDLKGWGAGLVVMGIFHFVLSSFLWAEWGVVLVILGILCFVVKHRTMFIPLGVGLIFIGFLNGFGGLETGNTFWTIFGGLQIYWGVKEIGKFKTYKKRTAQYQLEVAAEKE